METPDTSASFCHRLFVQPFRIRPSRGSIAAFYHQLAALLDAGVPILRALSSLEEQGTRARIRARLPGMIRCIEDGGTFGDALDQAGGAFDPVHVAILRTAEAGGRLTDALEELSESCKRRSRLIKLFIGAILYPAFVLHVAIVVLPLVEYFAQSQQAGPKASFLALFLPNVVLLYGTLAVLFVVPRVLRQFRPTAYALDWTKDCVPVLAGIAEKLALARFARALEGLYDSGVTLGTALPMSADACGNELLRRRVRRLGPKVRDGEPLSAAMQEVGDFPPAMVHMMATGDESGRLSDMLRGCAEYYEEEAETALKRTAIIVPVVILLLVFAYVSYGIIRFYLNLFRRTAGELDKVRP
jgi:type IV pilus assembly protein PilC